MVFGGERRCKGQMVRFQETLRRLAMIHDVAAALEEPDDH